MNIRTCLAAALVAIVFGAGARIAAAQNPVQWNRNVSQSVNRASEQTLPLLFWVVDSKDDDDLTDAQEECFRDQVVVEYILRNFIPVRVSRTSNVIQEARKLGLPDSHGLYCAVLTSDGRLLESMGPMEVADPAAFMIKLRSAYAVFCDDLYQNVLRPIFDDPSAPKSRVRLAAQTVWRLGVRSADASIIKLLDRTDLKGDERSRVLTLLAALGTQHSIGFLLDHADDKPAAAALMKADTHALEWLIPELPGEEGAVTARQLAAYAGAMQACRLGSMKAPAWWEKAKPEARRKELDEVRSRAQALLDYERR